MKDKPIDFRQRFHNLVMEKKSLSAREARDFYSSLMTMADDRNLSEVDVLALALNIFQDNRSSVTYKCVRALYDRLRSPDHTLRLALNKIGVETFEALKYQKGGFASAMYELMGALRANDVPEVWSIFDLQSGLKLYLEGMQTFINRYEEEVERLCT